MYVFVWYLGWCPVDVMLMVIVLSGLLLRRVKRNDRDESCSVWSTKVIII